MEVVSGRGTDVRSAARVLGPRSVSDDSRRDRTAHMARAFDPQDGALVLCQMYGSLDFHRIIEEDDNNVSLVSIVAACWMRLTNSYLGNDPL